MAVDPETQASQWFAELRPVFQERGPAGEMRVHYDAAQVDEVRKAVESQLAALTRERDALQAENAHLREEINGLIECCHDMQGDTERAEKAEAENRQLRERIAQLPLAGHLEHPSGHPRAVVFKADIATALNDVDQGATP